MTTRQSSVDQGIVNEAIANRFRFARIERRLTVEQAARDAGISVDQWRILESGTLCGVVEMAKAARTLKKSVEWLVFGES